MKPLMSISKLMALLFLVTWILPLPFLGPCQYVPCCMSSFLVIASSNYQTLGNSKHKTWIGALQCPPEGLVHLCLLNKQPSSLIALILLGDHLLSHTACMEWYLTPGRWSWCTRTGRLRWVPNVLSISSITFTYFLFLRLFFHFVCYRYEVPAYIMWKDTIRLKRMTL